MLKVSAPHWSQTGGSLLPVGEAQHENTRPLDKYGEGALALLAFFTEGKIGCLFLSAEQMNCVAAW